MAVARRDEQCSERPRISAGVAKLRHEEVTLGGGLALTQE
jgi:hypothetical protein